MNLQTRASMTIFTEMLSNDHFPLSILSESVCHISREQGVLLYRCNRTYAKCFQVFNYVHRTCIKHRSNKT
jgi:hypothetical protein